MGLEGRGRGLEAVGGGKWVGSSGWEAVGGGGGSGWGGQWVGDRRRAFTPRSYLGW